MIRRFVKEDGRLATLTGLSDFFDLVFQGFREILGHLRVSFEPLERLEIEKRLGFRPKKSPKAQSEGVKESGGSGVAASFLTCRAVQLQQVLLHAARNETLPQRVL